MELAFVTALGVGGATIIGVLIGFLFQKIIAKLHYNSYWCWLLYGNQ